jgi:DNA-binding transcriptional MerR regulator
MADRSHLSIGEVLSLLREEFPDVTISKIRFLESQGLVDPERTPSGYRKFYDQDVERLRWILRQQREHFLPLKVIRGRLSEHPEEAKGVNGAATESEAEGPDVHATSHAVPPAGEQSPVADRPTQRASSRQDRTAKASPRTQEPPTLPGLGSHPEPGQPEPSGRPDPSPRPEPSGRRAPSEPARREPSAGAEPDTYTAEELAMAAGATIGLVNELKQYGLISVHAVVAGTAYFDRSSLAITKAAAGFALHGVEARHLRAWRNSADREASLFEQLVMPLLRQRNPQARKQAADAVSDLSRLGGELRDALLEKALREIR